MSNNCLLPVTVQNNIYIYIFLNFFLHFFYFYVHNLHKINLVEGGQYVVEVEEEI